MSKLKNKLLGSSAWLTSEYFFSQALRLVANVTIARILLPEAFGIMALVQVFLQGMEMLSDVGIRGAIIKSDRRDDPIFLDTAWSVQVVRGIALFLLVIPLAPFYAASFNEPELTNLIIASSAINIIHCLAPTKAVLAGIAMQHKLLVILRSVPSLIGTITTIIVALITESIWAFVIGTLVNTLTRTSALYLFIKGAANRLRFDKDTFYEIVGFSLWIFISSAATFGLNQVDKIIIGSMLGVTVLGLYNVAFFIASAPQLLFQSINSRIGQPLHSNKSNTPIESIRKFQTYSVAGAACGLGILALAAPLLIDVLYDENYNLSSTLSPFIALALVPSILSSSYLIGLLARGHSKYVTYLMLTKLAFQLPLLYFFTAQWSIFGMILSLPVAELATYSAIQHYVRRFSIENSRLDSLLLSSWGVACTIIYLIHQDAIPLLMNYK